MFKRKLLYLWLQMMSLNACKLVSDSKRRPEVISQPPDLCVRNIT